MALPLVLTRSATVAPTTLNRATRSVEATWTTGAKVVRGLFEPFVEELSLDPAHVRLGRLTSGAAPVLAVHRADELDAVVGVVEAARLESGQGVARLRFAADDPKADAVWRKIEQGILRAVSVGYKVHRYETMPAADGSLPIRRAVDWEPYEISMVPMGADAGAVVRSEDPTMDHPETPSPTLPTETAVERTRVSTILTLTRQHELSDLGERLIRDGVPLDHARGAILDALATRSDAMGPSLFPAGARVSEPGLDGLEFRAAAADGLLLRAGIAVSRPHPAARDLATGSVHEIARVCLSRAGLRQSGMTPERLIERAMTTSDFPLILADSVGKAIRNGYETEPASHRAWVRPVPVRDFRDQKRPILGSAPGLLEVLEHGEYTEGPMDEDSATYTVSKFGRIVALTWEMLVNDDLGAFLRVQPALGQAARRKEADDVYALFALNSGAGPTMQDGTALFHSTHANLGTSGPYDAALLGAARTLLRKQTALGGGYLSLVPRFLIVPAEREQASEVLLAAATRTTTTAPAADTVPGWIGDLRLVVEPRLANGAVYLAADPAQIDTCELGLLEANQEGPMIEQERTFLQDIQRYKVRHVFAAKFLDWRGMVKQPLS